jgi:low temperature requirement protein LtrA
VFAVTQVTTLLSRHLTWSGFGHGVLVLALVWWAWSAFVWAVNAQAQDARVIRVVLLLASAFIFVTGLAVPEAFGSGGRVFAVSYAIVRLLHLGLYADASRRGQAAWSAIAGFSVTVVIGMALLIAGAWFTSTARIVLWILAVLIDYAGPAWLTRERLRGIQRVAVAHGLIATIGMWWTYFDRFAQRAEASLHGHRDPVLAAADSYSYIHLVIVAGIIIFAAGIRLLVRAPDSVPAAPARLALCAGIAAYLAGNVLFGMRLLGELRWPQAAAAAALVLLYALSDGISAWPLTAATAGLMIALCAVEARVGRA